MLKNKYLNFYNSLPKNLKRALYFTLILFFLASIFEALAIISIEPLVSNVLKASDLGNITEDINTKIFSFSIKLNIFELILYSFILSTSSILCRFISLKNTNKYAQIIGCYLSNRVLTSILINVEDLSNQGNQGSDSITNFTSSQVDYAVSSIKSQFQLIYNIFSAINLGLGIILIQPLLSFSLVLSLGLFFVLSALIIKPITNKNGINITKRSLISNKEALNLYQIRDQLRINKDFTNDTLAFNTNNLKLRMSIYINNFISVLPRMFIDYFLYLSIPILVFITLISKQYNFNISNYLPSLIAIGVAMQRMIPLINQLFRLWSRIKGFNPSLFRLVEMINESKQIHNYDFNYETKPHKINKKISIKNIEIDNITFITKEEKTILKNFNYSIKKGDSICVMGDSGVGKTTLIRLICGLQKSTSGNVFINNKNIENFDSFNHSSRLSLDISYLPQNGGIITGSIIESLTYFSNNIDMDKIEEILKITLCDEFIKTLPNGLNEIINDKSSIQLSGGQIQRLSIARVLYQNPSMIILDESTNALDQSKEENLIKNIIKYYDGIFIIISHRKNIASLFNKNILLKN